MASLGSSGKTSKIPLPRISSRLLAELELKFEQRVDAIGKAERVARSLHTKYYPDQEFSPTCYFSAGSFGKGTAIRPPSDVDLIFLLPRADFHRGYATLPVTKTQVFFGDNWQTKARTAYDRAVKACGHEHTDQGYSATLEWQKIFGPQFQLDMPNLFLLAGLGVRS